jgi:glycosyltransferase involved in cell wall biosynthesis
VLISSYKSDKYIEKCLKSLLNQTYDNYEIIIIEDPPYDNTSNIIMNINSNKIKYIRNPIKLGLTKTRNKCIMESKGNYIFFTDDDCYVENNWIEEGLNTFRKIKCLGVEGKSYYVSPEYEPTFSDGVYVRKTEKGGNYMTMNIAYKRELFELIGNFDEKLDFFEDRDLAIRTLQISNIHFNPNMVVYHQKITLSPTIFIKTAKRIKNRVILFKKYNEKPKSIWRVVRPLNLLILVFPPLLLSYLLLYKFNVKEDYILLPFIWFKVIYERLILWSTSLKENVFLI